MPGIIAPLVTGWILDNVQPVTSSVMSSAPWDMVFNVIIGVNIVGTVTYCALAQGTAQFR